MEAEFLRGLDYNLGVQVEEYNQWRVLLDGFILARQREATEMASYYSHSHSHLRSRPPITYSPQLPYTPLGVDKFPYQPLQAAITLPSSYRPRTRARSTSPQTWSPPVEPAPNFSLHSPPLSRKRSAEDAFAMDINQSAIYESLRQPSRRAVANGHGHGYNGDPVLTPTREISSGSGLGRSSSLNRQIARIPHSTSGRRGSFGHAHSTSAGQLEAMDYSDGSQFASLQAGIPHQYTSIPASAYGSPRRLSQPFAAVPHTSSYQSHRLYGSVSGMTAPASAVDLRHAATISSAQHQVNANAHAHAHAQAQAHTMGWSANPSPIRYSHNDEPETGHTYHEPDWNSLIAPYEQSQMQSGMVPPEHLMFYTLAAEAHPGQDGAPRKAMLRYQQPPYPYTFPAPAPVPATEPGIPAYAYVSAQHSAVPSFGMTDPSQSFQGYTFAPPVVDLNRHQSNLPPIACPAYPPHQSISHFNAPQPQFVHDTPISQGIAQPAQFANAGPPGYAYDARSRIGNSASNNSSTVNAGLVGLGLSHAHAAGPEGVKDDGSGVDTAAEEMQGVEWAPSINDVWRTRSEWSSPMPGQWQGQGQGYPDGMNMNVDWR